MVLCVRYLVNISKSFNFLLSFTTIKYPYFYSFILTNMSARIEYASNGWLCRLSDIWIFDRRGQNEPSTKNMCIEHIHLFRFLLVRFTGYVKRNRIAWNSKFKRATIFWSPRFWFQAKTYALGQGSTFSWLFVQTPKIIYFYDFPK